MEHDSLAFSKVLLEIIYVFVGISCLFGVS